MSLLSLANDLPETKQEFDLSSLSAAFVKALILRDDADGKGMSYPYQSTDPIRSAYRVGDCPDESGSVDNITDSQWALYTRKFNAQTQSLLQNSGHPTTASRALTVPQVDALAGSRSRGRRILSQNSNFERVESEDEAKMRIRKAWDLFTDPAQDFWIEHQRAALADGKDVLTELSDLRHMQSIFDSFTRVDAEACEFLIHLIDRATIPDQSSRKMPDTIEAYRPNVCCFPDTQGYLNSDNLEQSPRYLGGFTEKRPQSVAWN